MPMCRFDRVLILRLSALGDILHTLPAAAAIRRAWPQCRIGWVVESHTAFLLQGNPVVDHLHVLNTRAPRRIDSFWVGSREVLRTLSAIRRQRYQVSLDFQGLFKSAAIGFLAGIAQRWGHTAPFRRESGSALLINRPVTPEAAARHVIEQNNSLVEAMGIPTRPWIFPLPAATSEEKEIDGLLGELHLGDFVVLHPGAGWRTKIWAPSRWAELARQIDSHLGLTPLFTGGPGDIPLLQEIGSLLTDRIFHTLQTTFLQLVPLFRRTRLFIGGDTGPMQLACALGTPVVALFGPSTPERNGPFASADISIRHPLPCSDCYFRRCPYKLECMNIEVDEVLQAVQQRLSSNHRVSESIDPIDRML